MNKRFCSKKWATISLILTALFLVQCVPAVLGFDNYEVGLVAHWHLDEPYWNGTPLEVLDSSGNTLIDIKRFDNNADKRPLDIVEEEVYRIFHDYQALKASHEKLIDVLKHTDAYLKVSPLRVDRNFRKKFVEQALKKEGEI